MSPRIQSLGTVLGFETCSGVWYPGGALVVRPGRRHHDYYVG